MPSSSARFRRHFLPWDRPWLPQVAAWLARDWDGAGPLDLSATLAIVPTRQSARRLREALAEHAAGRGTAVFPPRTHTPDTLLALGATAPDVASRLQSLLAWAEVLRTLDPAAVPDVFPVVPPQRDFGWAWRSAGSFFRLQTQLAEGGLAFADVGTRAGAGFPEAARWAQLALLEQMQADALGARGWREPHEARRTFARQPALPTDFDRIVVLASPDPLSLTLDILAVWAESVPVEVVIFAPVEESAAFDEFGRPLPAVWGRRPIELADFEKRVRACADPGAEAARAAELAGNYCPPDGVLAFGLADADVLPPLEHELSRAEIAAYNPEGRLRSGEGFYALLAALSALAREPAFDTVAALARCPDFLARLQARSGEGFSAAGFLAELDALHARHLPADLAAALAATSEKQKHLAAGLVAMEELRAALVGGAFPGNAVAGLTILFGPRQFDLAVPDEARLADAAEAWREVMRECAGARASAPELSTADWWEVALGAFGEMRRTEEKPAGALELQGWLELLWEDAPHLVIAGFNDGFVPDAIVGDAFLPESLRQTLGLKTNAARFARDAYLLQAIAASRAKAGRLDVLFAKNSAAGDPLRPSRLLLRCDDAALPGRVAFLFRPVESARPNLPWMRAWQLTPRRVPAPARVSVTALRTWLACPFRFYLTHVLRMEPVEPAKSELDARDFGTLCHTALEAMARSPSLRDCTDEKTLRDCLLGELDRAARVRYGANLTLPLVVQLESARQRLGRVAAIQARERAEGWVIERVESAFSLDVAGLEIRGKIDRIDRHEGTGAWRVLDYKTSDAASSPQKSHLRTLRAGDGERPAWMRVTLGGREQVWTDLQLPLYLRAMARELPAAVLSCGYINLPKATGETALALWPDLDGELIAAAGACTDGLAAAIRGGEFWPPAEVAADRDAFAALFHHGAGESVAWEAPA